MLGRLVVGLSEVFRMRDMKHLQRKEHEGKFIFSSHSQAPAESERWLQQSNSIASVDFMHNKWRGVWGGQWSTVHFSRQFGEP
jgi:hypothetical protein